MIILKQIYWITTLYAYLYLLMYWSIINVISWFSWYGWSSVDTRATTSCMHLQIRRSRNRRHWNITL